MLNEELDLVMVDFGISIKFTVEDDVLKGRTMGTCKYFAPEIVRTGVKDKKVHGMKADMWAAGVTLYQLATGVHPFPAKD